MNKYQFNYYHQWSALFAATAPFTINRLCEKSIHGQFIHKAAKLPNSRASSSVRSETINILRINFIFWLFRYWMKIYSLVFMAYFSRLSLSLHVASVYIVSLCVNTGDFSFSFIRIARTTIACVSIFVVVIFQVAELKFIHRKSTSPSTTFHRDILWGRKCWSWRIVNLAWWWWGCQNSWMNFKEAEQARYKFEHSITLALKFELLISLISLFPLALQTAASCAIDFCISSTEKRFLFIQLFQEHMNTYAEFIDAMGFSIFQEFQFHSNIKQ